MRNLPSKTRTSSPEAELKAQYESLQRLCSSLATRQPIQSGELDTSAYQALFRESKKICKQIAALENKISHLK